MQLLLVLLDKVGGVLNYNGYSLEEIIMLLENRTSNFLESDNIIPFDEINHKIWSLGAEIFVPAASSRLITQEQLIK